MINIIKDFKQKPLIDAKFISTHLVSYEQNGVEKDWEVVEAHDSVAILVYHKHKSSFVLVKQFRPAVYLKNADGLTVELCAGIVDKDLSLVQIAKEEVEEECGYSVSIENIEKISSFYTSVGFAGSKQTLYYAEVDDDIKVSDGGGIDNEQIEVIYMSTDSAKEFIFDFSSRQK